MSKAKILVIRGGAIGDFILTLPAIAALRQQFPHTHIEILGYQKIASLALQSRMVNQVKHIEARPLAGFFASRGELCEDLRDYFSEFSIIISYLYDPDEIFRTNIARCSPAQFIQGPHRPNENEKIHASNVFLKPLERLAIFDADHVPGLRLDCDVAISPNTIALHPGSGSESKNWPEDKWSEFLAILVRATNLKFLLVGGEAEGARLNRLASRLQVGRFEIVDNLPLPELATRLQCCAAFVGHDSGITHLAAALALPCLAIWAHTEQSVWRPLGRRITILHDPAGIQTLAANRVADELLSMLAATTTASRQSP